MNYATAMPANGRSRGSCERMSDHLRPTHSSIRSGLILRLAMCMAFCLSGTFDSAAQVQSAGDDPDIAALKQQPITGDEFHLVLEDAEARRVEELVSALAGPDFAARENSASDLIEIGAPAFKRLREAYHQADDLESRLRIEEIVRSAYLNHHVLDQFGFLGISMQPYTDAVARSIEQQAKNPQGQTDTLKVPKLPPGRAGVWVFSVTPDSGAFRAGIERGDVLISLNGVPVEGAGSELIDKFSAEIRGHKPGSKITIELVRGEELLTVEPIVSRAPQRVAAGQSDNTRGVIKVTPLYHAVADRFITWWDKYFVDIGTLANKTESTRSTGD